MFRIVYEPIINTNQLARIINVFEENVPEDLFIKGEKPKNFVVDFIYNYLNYVMYKFLGIKVYKFKDVKSGTYMIKDLENTVWIGLEYFVNEGDEFWNMTEEEFSALGIKEMVQLGLIDSADQVIDTHMEKVKKAYPAYFDTYNEMDTLVSYLKSIDNLYCVGRNGQHRYNNIDHSMCTSFETVKNILNGSKNKDNIWSVNTEQEYHEASAEEVAEVD